MQFSAHQIATLVNGSLEGNPDVMVEQLAKIEEASTGSLSFLSNPKYEQYLYTTRASVIIINEDLKLDRPIASTLIRVKNAYTAFSLLLELYNKMRLDKAGIEEPVFIHPSAKIGKNVYIGAFAYIDKDVVIGDNAKIYPHVYIGDNVKIGHDTTLFAGVSVYFDCVIGSHVIIHSGTVIGSDGFGFAPQEDGTYNKISQIGNVVIEDKVEIGANTVIDRATMGSTIIREGVKLDNLIQIAHNVEIGKHTVIAAQSGISGSTKVGENTVIGGQVGIVGHINIANGSQIQAQSGVNRTIAEEGKKWSGSPATPYNAQMRSQVVYSRLPELERRLEELEQLLLTKELSK
ncbi:UDP-3-O-(3-hydroxymyristoyl)glucosamine N-acyltransferase [Parapedobacter sp. ISTM3]|uniref:UDP-3-O-(3-hydroxymyristoyl)glucosamine N-acyltransferase n=1 Tax=Parapedobacter sp. ISTM3 TaxID=2800130 RepID=UPI001906F1A7|nr:UDP-3-O-(3-hydroxymyristoyl)glucosamine N-acyltransferase [Parapedobacter sp. ISTM3]MBK1442073.1 UDP-3-O-(3-hydroxymyristoyl)glucosamine N-acyltransferase [Parapedobacter sp. ISTM3]